MDYQNQNDWYLLSHGFQRQEGYYFHFDRRIVVTDNVIQDYELEKVKQHVENAKDKLITFIFSKHPEPGILDEIMTRHEWEGKREIIILN